MILDVSSLNIMYKNLKLNSLRESGKKGGEKNLNLNFPRRGQFNAQID